MRRLLVGLMIVALVGTSAEAFRGRFGRGAHSQQQQPAANPDPPPTSYIENLSVEKIATDGYCRSGGGALESAIEPEVGDDAVYVAYMTNDNGCGTGSRTHKVMKWDYTTGAWTSSASLDGGNPSGTDVHEVGSVFRNASGFLFLAHSPVLAGQTGTGLGPFYYKSSSANSVSAWGSQLRLVVDGGTSSSVGGFQGLIGMICGGIQIGSTAPLPVNFDTWCSRTEDGGDTWEAGMLVGDETGSINGKSGGSSGDPGTCTRSFYVEPSPSTIMHVFWGGMLDGCGGSTSGGWYAKSEDGGATWTSVNDTQSVSWPNGITPLSHDGTIWQWHTDYRVFTGTRGAQPPMLRTLSDGRPIVVAQGFSTAARAYVYSGSGTTWDQSTIATGTSGCGITMEVSATGRVYVWTTDCVDIYQYTSDDDGATWSSATKIYDSSLVNFKLRSRSKASIGGKNRARLTWLQDPGGTASSTRSDVMTLDVVMQ